MNTKCPKCAAWMYEQWTPYPIGPELACRCGKVIYLWPGVAKEQKPARKIRKNLPICEKKGCENKVKTYLGAIKYCSIKCCANDKPKARAKLMEKAKKAKK